MKRYSQANLSPVNGTIKNRYKNSSLWVRFVIFQCISLLSLEAQGIQVNRASVSTPQVGVVEISDHNECIGPFLNLDWPEPLVVNRGKYPSPELRGKIITDKNGKKFHLIDIGNFAEWIQVDQVKREYLLKKQREGQTSSEGVLPGHKVPVISYEGQMREISHRLKEMRRWTTQEVIKVFTGADKNLSERENDLLISEDSDFVSDHTLSRYYVLFDYRPDKMPWDLSEEEWKNSIRFSVRMAFSKEVPVRSFFEGVVGWGVKHHLPHFSRYLDAKEQEEDWFFSKQELYEEALSELASLGPDEQWVEFSRLANFTRSFEPEDPRKLDDELVERLIEERFVEIDVLNQQVLKSGKDGNKKNDDTILVPRLAPGFSRVSRIVATGNKITLRLFLRKMGLPFELYGKPKISRENEDEIVFRSDMQSEKFKEFVKKVKNKYKK